MKTTLWRSLLSCIILLTAFEATADAPATLVGRVTRDGKPGKRARIEVMSVPLKMTREDVALRIGMTDDAGHFTVLGLSPAAVYAIRVTFADGYHSTGPVWDIRAGDVRHVGTTIHTSFCPQNIWLDEPGQPQQVFEWPLRVQGVRYLWICE